MKSISKRLRDRLASNPRVQLDASRPIDRRKLEDAIGVLDVEADAMIKQMATTVFLTTAVSQSGRLDALLGLERPIAHGLADCPALLSAAVAQRP